MDNYRIRLRNLDPEVLEYFRKTNEKIGFDGLNSDVVVEIKNDAASGLAYNDAELRNRIIALETDYVKTSVGDSRYALKSNTYTKTETDNKISALSSSINSELSDKLSVSDAETLYIKNVANIITETMLSTDLQNKVNARYENKRPEDSSGSEVSISDFNLLKVAVNTNTSNINDILGSYVTKNTTIPLSQLDSNTQKIVNTARTTSVKITESDLSETLVSKINSSGGGSSSVDNMVYELVNSFKGEYGQLFYAKLDDDGNTKIIPRYLYAEEVLLVSKASDLATAKSYSLSQDYDYIGDIANNQLVYYSDTQTWEVYDEETLFEYIIGRFAKDYSTGNIYYGSDETTCEVFIDTTVYETKTAHQNDLVNINTEISNLRSDIDTLETNNSEDIKLLNTTISSISSSVSTLDTQLNQLKSTVTSNKTSADSSISSINSQISTINTNISTLSASITTLTDEIEAIKTRLNALETAAGTTT